MKKVLLNIILVLMTYNLGAQETFSVSYDFQKNDLYVYPWELHFHNNRYYILSSHLCLSNPVHFCAGLTKLSSEGRVLKKRLFNNFLHTVDCFLEYNDGFLISGHQYGNFHTTTILEIDTNLNIVNIFSTDTSEYSRHNLGMQVFQNDIYVYGKSGKDSVGIYLTKLSGKNFNTLWTKEYNLGMKRGILDFDTTDKELVYVSQFDMRPAGANQEGEYEFEIMKLDTAGNTLDSFVLVGDDFYKAGYLNIICTDNRNNLYFTTEYTLTDEYNGGGVINKINHTLDSILWSIPLPKSNIPILYGRFYSINKIIQDRNCIIACGRVNSGRVKHSSVGYILQGFIVKLTLSGEVRWIHYYRFPKDNPDNITGNYKFSQLCDIIKNKFGGYSATGFIQYYQNPDSLLQIDHWLLSVDENGCLDGEECSEVIVIDGKVDTLYNYYFVNPRNEWNILISFKENGVIKKKTVRYRFSSDTSLINGIGYHELLSTESKTEPISHHTGAFYRQDTDKVWKWTPEGEELIYNFNQWIEGLYYMYLEDDTVSFIITPEVRRLIDGSRRRTLLLEGYVENVEDHECNFTWIEGIGSLYGFPYDKNKCKKGNFTSQLLCFYTDDELLYKNENISGCYLVSNDEIELSTLKIYPNPVKKTLIIENYSDISRVEIYNTIGQLMIKIDAPGNTINVSELPAGAYFITIYRNSQELLRMKFIKQ